MKKISFFFVLVIALLLILLTGCTQTIKEVKSDEFLGQEVTIKGTVLNSFKLGQLSGYNLEDDSKEQIFVSATDLPSEGKIVKVTGTIKKIPILNQYYLDTKELD